MHPLSSPRMGLLLRCSHSTIYKLHYVWLHATSRIKVRRVRWSQVNPKCNPLFIRHLLFLEGGVSLSATCSMSSYAAPLCTTTGRRPSAWANINQCATSPCLRAHKVRVCGRKSPALCTIQFPPILPTRSHPSWRSHTYSHMSHDGMVPNRAYSYVRAL